MQQCNHGIFLQKYKKVSHLLYLLDKMLHTIWLRFRIAYQYLIKNKYVCDVICLQTLLILDLFVDISLYKNSGLSCCFALLIAFISRFYTKKN